MKDKVRYINGVKYELVTSSREYKSKEPKSIIETIAPIVAEMDILYFKIRNAAHNAKENRP